MIRIYQPGKNERISAHFMANEFKCKCGKDHEFKVDDELIQKLEALREKLNCSKINVTSGFRCVAHDKSVGGSGTGQHTLGKAADICCYDAEGRMISSKIVCCAAQDIGFHGIANITAGYVYTHVDTRNGKWYGDEVHGNSYCIPSRDFYEYYGIEKGVESMKKGIDVSEHQGKIDWTKVVTDFAILRAGYGKSVSQKDKQFDANYSGAKAQNIHVGAYWYSYAMTPDEARREADCLLEVIKGKQFEYPIYFDLEEDKQLKLGKEMVSAIITAFLERVEAAGYWVGLYMSASPLNTLVSDEIKKRYAVWVAHIGVSKPGYNGTYGVWQYSWKGSVNGISGDVDMDYSYVDYPLQIKAKGLNGYGGKPPEQDTVLDEITVEMTVNGKKYSGKLKEVK